MRWIEIEDTTWPVDVDGHTQDRLRYGTRDDCAQERFAAASIMSAYAYLTDPTLTQADAIVSLKRARKARKSVGDEEQAQT